MSSGTRPLLIGLLIAAALGVGWYRSQVYSKPHAPDRPKFIVVTGGSSSYWQLLSDGAKAAGQDLGAEVTVLSPENDEDVEAQTKLLTSVKHDEIDGVALSPLDAAQQTRIINDMAEDTLVLSVDSDAPLSNRHCYIGASNYAAGRNCGKTVREAIGNGGKLIVLAANLTKDNILERKQGLEEELSESPATTEEEPSEGYEIVQVLVDEGDQDRCVEQLVSALEQHNDIAGVIGLNSYHGGCIVKALKQRDALGKVKVVAFDTVDDTLKAIEDGYIDATIAQDPYQYGYEAINWMMDNFQRSGHQLPLIGVQNTWNISTKPLKADSLKEFRKLQNERLGRKKKSESVKSTD